MSARGPVVAGTDGSEPAMAAIRWAAVEAHRRETTLTVVNAYDESWSTMPGLPWQHRSGTPEDQAEAVVTDARLLVASLTPTVTVHTEIAPGDPATVLLRHAASAGLLVVGHRGRGGFTSLMLGSVSQRVATRATCPVVVVRGRVMAFTDPVVVGADDSPGGRAAIETAFALTDARHTVLLAVRAYRDPLPPMTPGLPLILPVDMPRLEKAVARELDELLKPWRHKYPRGPGGDLGRPRHPGPAARRRVPPGTTAGAGRPWRGAP